MVSRRWAGSGTLRALQALVMLAAGGTATRASAQAVIGPVDRYVAVSQALTAFIEQERRERSIPALSIALVDDQQIVWSRGFGTEDAKAGRAATAQTVYRVGSVSKLFTDIGVMQLVERGEINLDAPVQKYLPSFHPRNSFGVPITLRQLMSHHSGLVREPPVGHYFDDTSPSLAATVASLNTTALVYAPGATQKYSNAAIATVGYLLEQRGHTPFAAYLQRAVLAPMGLQSSAFAPTPALLVHVPQAEMWSYHHHNFPAPTFQLGMSPAGSMYATMPDLGRFISVLFNGGVGSHGRVIEAKTLEAMWQPQFAPPGATQGSGLGFVVGTFDGTRAVQHGGAINGFATQLAAHPDQKRGVAVSAARDGDNALTSRIAREALRLMRAAREGKPLPTLTHTMPVPLALAQHIAGDYGAGDSLVSVEIHDSSVVASGPLLEHRLGLRVSGGDTLISDDGLSYGRTVRLDGDRLLIDGHTLPRRAAAAALAPEPPSQWRGLIGEYGWDHDVLYILEREGRLTALIEWFFEYPLTQVSENVYAFPQSGLYAGERIEFVRDRAGRATLARAAGVSFKRRTWTGEDGGIFRIAPMKPVSVLRAAALAAHPPTETGTFRDADLAELITLDSSIHLDIRYASDRNFLSTPMYSQARAFLQRPAADALVRVHRKLAAQGYGLLIHDGYRPWYVTKMFWDGTPVDKHQFVADPASGSRHNRGGAVDLTMYDLHTGQPIVTTGGYDEMSDRSYPEYPGGTGRQRALREILRAAMESEGFHVFEAEWWHFDWKDWRQYRIGNQRFEEFGK